MSGHHDSYRYIIEHGMTMTMDIHTQQPFLHNRYSQVHNRHSWRCDAMQCSAGSLLPRWAIQTYGWSCNLYRTRQTGHPPSLYGLYMVFIWSSYHLHIIFICLHPRPGTMINLHRSPTCRCREKVGTTSSVLGMMRRDGCRWPMLTLMGCRQRICSHHHPWQESAEGSLVLHHECEDVN